MKTLFPIFLLKKILKLVKIYLQDAEMKKWMLFSFMSQTFSSDIKKLAVKLNHIL
jgi:hypothetical protein